MGQKPLALMLLGPTASGKSALAHQLAQATGMEIISLDSAQVYCGLDIGSAKPSRGQLTEVPYHLIDIAKPTEPFSVAAMLRACHSACESIWQRGKVALLVGGTMLYAKALLEGINDLPPTDPQLRQQVQSLSAQQRWQRLQQLDPESAAHLAAGDSQRVQRALEVYLSSGRSIRSYWQQPKQGALAQRCQLRSFALSADNKSDLQAAIGQRLVNMLRAGWIDELRQLQRQYPELHADHNAVRLIGYRRIWHYLANTTSYSSVVSGIRADTLGLAKRQLTWLRSLPASIQRHDWRQPQLAYDAMRSHLP